MSKTPMELWSGKKPSVRHLRTYGCLVYYRINKPNMSKLQPRAKKGILVGYSKDRKAYRIYDEQNKAVFETIDVKFDESSRGIILTSNINNTVEANNNILQYIVLNTNQSINEHDKDNSDDNSYIDKLDTEPDVTPNVETTENNQNNRPQRKRQPPSKFGDYVASFVSESEPRTYEDVIESSDKEKWLAAMESEMQSMRNLRVWEEIERPTNSKVLKSKWIFKIKQRNGPAEIYKARLVAAGHNQKLGFDYEESFSPVIRYETLRTLLSIAVIKGARSKFYDVRSAYLNADLTETVYMEQPPGYNHNQNRVYRLRRSIYGLPQSGRCWYMKLSQIMTDRGFRRLNSDPCVFIRKEGEKFIIVGVYVDDFLVIGDSDTTIDHFINNIKIEIKMEEINNNVFLGIEIKDNGNEILLTQSGYIEKLLNKYGMRDANSVTTPGLSGVNLDNYHDSDKIPRDQYQEAIGSIIYLSRGTRPDIAYTISKLSQYNTDPRKIHWAAIKRVLRYLKGTKDMCLKLSDKYEGLSATADAGWCTTADGKSFSGFNIKLGESLVNWKSGKQKMVTLSTMEAELMAVCDAQCEINFMMNLLEELDEEIFLKKPVKIYTDSKAVMDWTVSNKQSSRTKHINRKYNFVKDEIEKGNTTLVYKRSEEMEADIFTKDLPRSTMDKHLQQMGLVNGHYEFRKKEGIVGDSFQN